MPKSITIPEMWDENTSSFITVQNDTLIIEHSLVSLHEWEKRWKKPFLSDSPKTLEELLDYIKCMTINKDSVDQRIYSCLPYNVLKEIKDYIDDPMTATTVYDMREQRGSQTITAEIIYYSMIAYNIPFECASWHLNTLMALIKVCSAKNDTSKMSRSDNGRYQRTLNEQRLKKLRK